MKIIQCYLILFIRVLNWDTTEATRSSLTDGMTLLAASASGRSSIASACSICTRAPASSIKSMASDSKDRSFICLFVCLSVCLFVRVFFARAKKTEAVCYHEASHNDPPQAVSTKGWAMKNESRQCTSKVQVPCNKLRRTPSRLHRSRILSYCKYSFCSITTFLDDLHD